MVERVARGRIMVPAAAALTVMAAGMLASKPAQAAGRQATLEIRVQVVEPCRIRIGPSGALEQNCSGSSFAAPPVTVRLGDLVERSAIGEPAYPRRVAPPSRLVETPQLLPRSGSPPPAIVAPATASARFAAANQRASDIAATISQRVRFITVAY